MKLLFVIKSLSVAGGGAERVLAEIASGLAANGHEIVVASYDQPDCADFYAMHKSIRRVRLGIGHGTRSATVPETLARIRALRAHVRRDRPDIAIGFMHSVYIPLGAALLGTGIPVIASEHIVFGHYRDKPLQALLLRLSPRLFAAMTAISEHIRSGYPKAVRRRMTIIPNPVSAAPSRRADVEGGERKILLTVGRLAEQKDHKTLVSAFALLAPDFPDWDLRIVGDGELRGELEAQVRALGLEDRIVLAATTPDIGAEYERAQLFVMPSSYESFGLVTAEALAHGLPAIGFGDCPGTNELIQPGRNGLLVTGADRPRALADGLAQLMRDPALRARLAAAGPASVEPYSLGNAIAAWESLARRIGRNPDAPAQSDAPA